MPPKAPLTVKEFLFLLATDPKALARYNDPKKRARLLAQYLSPENRRLLSQPDAIQIRYSIELEARAADALKWSSSRLTASILGVGSP